MRAMGVAIALVLAGCAAERPSTTEGAVATTDEPSDPSFLAEIGTDGYATILDAPPAPYEAADPAPPQPTPRQIEGQREFARVGDWQNRIREEVDRVHERLRTREAGNFQELYFDNEAFEVVFLFLRDPEATLARYTDHEDFVAKRTMRSQEALQTELMRLFKVLEEERVIEGAGTARGRISLDSNVTRAQFEAALDRRGIVLPDYVDVTYRYADQFGANGGLAVPDSVAPFLRIFPTDDRPVGIVNSIESRLKVTLVDGCFRLPEQGNALALLPMGARLFVDDEGYLAFGDREVPGYARVGETIAMAGSVNEVTIPELVEPIHAACGEGRVIRLTGLESAAASQADNDALENYRAAESFRDYGFDEATVALLMKRCREKLGGDRCIMSPPPPRMPDEECPDGSTLSFGLCRTEKGHIRPIPAWIDELLVG